MMPAQAGVLAPDQAWMPRRVRTGANNLWKSLSWAWLDTVCQYRRSRIGPLWETINVLVMLIGLTVVSSSVFGSSIFAIIGHAGIGIIVWSAIASLVIEGPGTFVRNCGNVTNSRLSIDLYVGRAVFKTLITFSHHFVIYFIGALFGLVPIGAVSLLAIPGIALLFVNGWWVAMVLGLICARFRDVEPFVRNIMQLAFFVTPVFWNYRQISVDRRFLVDGNPLFYFIEIIRKPLLGEVPPLTFYAAVLGVTVFGYALAYYVHRRMRQQLAFYL
jgi:ABC-2 type transport system permease protein/lipopolysaccharide transport system permease protein